MMISLRSMTSLPRNFNDGASRYDQSFRHVRSTIIERSEVIPSLGEKNV
jgi:hypothetical protein